MTVQELIDKLRTYPGTYDVNVWLEDAVWKDFEYPVKGIYDQREETNAVDLII